VNKKNQEFITLKGKVVEIMKGNYFKVKLDNGYNGMGA